MNADVAFVPTNAHTPADGEIDLWLVFQQETNGEALLDDYRAMLTEEERLRESRFCFEQHRRQYLVTRALIRTVLSGYFAVDRRTHVRWNESYVGVHAAFRPKVNSVGDA